VKQERTTVDQFVERDFNGYSAPAITQYLRGKLFVFVDFLLSNNTITYSETDIDEINELIKAVLRLIVAWLKKVTTLFESASATLKRD
jgi:hypothetical protein